MTDFPPLPPPDANWALFLDIDGTLIDLAATPDAVVVPPELPGLLGRVEEVLGRALAIVSGRELPQIDALLRPWRGTAAAEHGALCRLPSGEIVRPTAEPVPEAWRTAMVRLAADVSGVGVENKESSITLHYRLAPERRDDVLAAARRLVRARPDAFVITQAHEAIEIRPAGIDKGLAVRRFMQECLFRSRVPVFVGDDVTDEDGMDAAIALGGYGLHVHEYFPLGVKGVRDWLIGIATSLGSN